MTGVLIVDLETTSTNPQRAHILEVGAALLDLDNMQVQILVDSLVRPDCPEEEWLCCWFMNNANLAPEQVRAAPSWAQVSPRIKELCAAWPVTAFNRSYDIQVLYRHGVPTPMRAPCLMLAAKDVCRLPGWSGDYKYPKFAEAWREFFPEEPFEEKHRAGYDAVHEARLCGAMYARGLWKMDVHHFTEVK